MPNSPKESAVLRSCLDLCAVHHSIAWAYRMNTGRGKFRNPGSETERWVTFAFKGCSDIIGQIIDGRFFAWEVKRPGEKPTDNQRAFLEVVAGTGGVAGWSDNVLVLYNRLQTLELLASPKLGIVDGKFHPPSEV